METRLTKEDIVNIIIRNLQKKSSKQFQCIESIPKFTSGKNSNKNYQKAAILCLLYWHKNEIHTVFIERNQYDGHHSGQISFPGGKAEEKDGRGHSQSQRAG